MVVNGLSVTLAIMLLVVFASHVWLIMLDVNKRNKEITIVISVQLRYVLKMTAYTMNYVVETYKEIL